MDVPHKMSPGKPRTSPPVKPKASTPDSTPSPNHPRRTPKEHGPKTMDRRPARTSAPEKRRSNSNRTHDLESEHTKLLDDLKKVKEQLSSSECRRRRAQQEVDEARTQLFAVSGMPDGDVSNPVALSSAVDDLQKLKLRLEQAETEQAEARKLRRELEDTVSLVGRLRSELDHSREMELRSEAAISASLSDLKQSREKVELLESLLKKLRHETAGNETTELEKVKAERDAVIEEMREKRIVAKRVEEENLRLRAEMREMEEEREGTANLEAEVRRLKVQSEQWRKAAEAATAILCEGSPVLDETEGCTVTVLGDSPKKRGEKMLTRIGEIWKKGLK